MQRLIPCLIAATLVCISAAAHVDGKPSFHDTISSVLERLKDAMAPEDLRSLRVDDLLPFLNEEEKDLLGRTFMTFDISEDATVHVVRHARQRELPYWLEARGFKKTDMEIEIGDEPFEVWAKDFDAGSVGLGISGFDVHRVPYFVIVTPQKRRKEVEIANAYPGRHSTTEAKVGAFPYQGEMEYRIAELPAALEGGKLIRTYEDRNEESLLVRVYRAPPYVATEKPDQVVLTWSADPKTTQTVQWRTSPAVAEGWVEFKPAAGGAPTRIAADQSVLIDPLLVNDDVNHRFTAVMTGLSPATDYRYRVGTGREEAWTEWFPFTTAPAEAVPFKFVYMGDAQNGLDTWGKLAQDAHRRQPDAAFYVMAGDLVNRGIQRDDWDSFFHNAAGIYDRKQLIPAIGNHEDQGEDGPWMYLDVFDLPKNGPAEGITPERAYTLNYSNAIFIVLDTNVPPQTQTDWLEEQLANTDATWKFVVYHHPAYSSSPGRDNPHIRKSWGTLFDKYQVDLALQGHDHAYLRTYPMYNDARVDSPAEGTIYIVSVSGTKYYDQDGRDYTEFGMTNTSTYQVLDITIDGNKLEYTAYDMDGAVRDRFVIEK